MTHLQVVYSALSHKCEDAVSSPRAKVKKRGEKRKREEKGRCAVCSAGDREQKKGRRVGRESGWEGKERTTQGGKVTESAWPTESSFSPARLNLGLCQTHR